MIPTPAHHLTTVIDHWDDLRGQLDTPNIATWPPSGLAAYLAALDDDAYEQYLAGAAAERAERSELALGEHAIPLRLAVLDAIRTVQAALVETADQIASSTQRPPISAPPAGRGWTDELHRTACLLAAQDAADTRRWQYRGERTAVQAAEWLLGRVQGQFGPFRPLTAEQQRHIANVAAEAADRVERALGRTHRVLDRPCPRCGGDLTMHNGGVQQPLVDCRDCGRSWTGHELYQLLRALERASDPM